MEKGHGKWRFTSPTHVVRAFKQAMQELKEEGGIEARHRRYCQNHDVLVQGMRSLGFRTFVEKSQVTFKALEDVDIERYLDAGESYDKAGAYAIQGEGGKLVERYEGDYDTIVGLPVTRLLDEYPELRR